MRQQDVGAKILNNRAVDPVTGCWNWTRWRTQWGYARFRINGKMIYGHRASYEHFKGPIPRGLSVCHSCDNPACLNPDHLWLGTPSDNVADCVAKGRQRGPRGVSAPRARLTPGDVAAIRAELSGKYGEASRLARRYGVVPSTICRIRDNDSWRAE